VTDLQALVTGVIAGILSKPDSLLLLDVAVEKDDKGQYKPLVHLTGKASGERLTVHVTPRVAQ
jgi:hypothetical protein